MLLLLWLAKFNTDLVSIGVAAVNQLLVGVIQHPQLRLIRALVQQRAQKAEVGNDLAGLGLAEAVRQLQHARLAVLGQGVATARQHADL